MAKTDRSISISRAFLIDEKAVRDLYGVFEAFCDQVGISADVPNAKISFENVDEFLGFQNSQKRPIQGLRIAGRSSSSSFRCTVKFSSPYILYPVEYDAQGDDADVFMFGNKIEDILSGLYQCHSFISAASPFVHGIFGVISFSVKIFALGMLGVLFESFSDGGEAVKVSSQDIALMSVAAASILYDFR